jgi:GTP-binding protein
LVPQAQSPDGVPEQAAEHTVYRPTERGWTVDRTSEGSFRLSGSAIERLVERHDLENQEALAYIEERLKAMGVLKKLEAQGFEPGNEVEIGEVAFALYPGVPQE